MRRNDGVLIMFERIVIETMYWGGILGALFLVGWYVDFIYRVLFKLGPKKEDEK